MKRTNSSTSARCSSIVTLLRARAAALADLPREAGRPVCIARLYDESEHVRIGNTLIIRSMVSCTAQIFGYGPKYFAPLILRLRVTITRGASSPRVIAMYGYDLSSRNLTLNGGSNSLIQVYSSWSASISEPTVVHSTLRAVSTMRRVRSCSVGSGAK